MQITVQVTFVVDEAAWPEPGRGQHTGPASRRFEAYIRDRASGPLPAGIAALLPEFQAAGGRVVISKPEPVETS